MPLSDNEQRLLAEMEQALSAEDPRFASAMRGSARRALISRVLLGGAVVVIGLFVIIAGVANNNLLLGVGGFVAMLGGTALALSKPKAATGPQGLVGEGSVIRPPRNRTVRKKPSGGGFMARMEQRWDKRQR